jgi:hypothetical protein
MLNVRRLLASLLVIALALAGVGAVAAQENDTPSLTIEDQYLYITVDTVVMDGPGWVVVHADDNGSPGPVIGYTQVDEGENTDVEVQLDPTMITETLHVMLHEDTGEEGVFDFPDADPPVEVDGEIVMTAINLQVPEDVDDVDDDVDDVDPTPTPVDEDVEATPTPEDVEATPTPEDEDVDAAEVEETPTPTPTPADEEVDATPTPDPDDEDVDATPTPDPDDDEVVEVIPELGANIPMLPMLGLAAAGALLLGVGFVFAYRKQD